MFTLPVPNTHMGGTMRHTLALTLTAVAALTLTGCGGDDEPKADAKPKDQTKAAAPAAIPSPDAPQTETLLSKLRTIKPELVTDEERAVSRSRNVCSDVRAEKDETTMAKNANARFSGGTAGQLTDEQGAKIVSAVKSSFCS
ncbi:hypothetical protein [Streptomyces sp. NPDC055099]